MTVLRRFAVAVSLLLLVGGCSTKPVDYRSIWTTSSAAPTTTAPAKSTFPYLQYLQDRNVAGTAMTPQNLTDLTVSMPQPPGWAVVNDPSQASAFEVLRKTDVGAFQPTATVFVFKLTGDFDVNEALKKGYGMPGAKIQPFHGMPSSVIEATYAESGGQNVHRYNQIIFATARPPTNQRYLIQFSITTSADQAGEQDPSIITIIKGFTVTVR